MGKTVSVSLDQKRANSKMCFVLLLCSPVGLLTPPPHVPVQHWGVSTLHDQIRAGHVSKVAIHSGQTAVEVLDINGIARRVEIFPAVTPLLIDDMREAHVGFF